MRRPETNAARLVGPALLALLAPAATAQETVPPPGRPVTLPPPATAEEVQATTPAPTPVQVETPAPAPAPGQVETPADAPATTEDQEQQDKQLAEAMRDPSAPAPADVAAAIPAGFVRIAIDLDNDGTFDAVETINAEALRQARGMGADPQMVGPGAGVAGMPGEAAGMAPAPGIGELSLSGTVQDVQEFRLAGQPSPHRIARVLTDQGVAKVDLGPADALQAMGVEPGAEIRVVGRRGMINDRPVLMALEVSMGDQSAAIESPDDLMIKRVRGEVRGLRSASFRTRDEEHLIAELELRNGQQVEVILGPKAKFDGVELSEGDQVALLVRPARLNGRLAMAAEQVRVGDTAVAIGTPVEEPVETEPGSESEVPPDPAPEAGAQPEDAPDLESPTPDLGGTTGTDTEP